MKLNIFPSSLHASRALINYIIDQLVKEPERVFNIAFSGGNTPMLMFDLWANEYADITPWKQIRFFWVDERCVKPESVESNYGQMKRLLLDVVGIPEENIFQIHGENDPEKEAIRYSDIVTKSAPVDDGFPIFDIVLAGIGTDGHTSSIFPGQEYLLSSKKIYEVSVNPSLGQKRIAMTGFPIIKAKKTIFLVTGKSKASVIRELYSGGDITPSSYIARRAENIELFLDADAAKDLPDEISNREPGYFSEFNMF